jgi:uncharacterized phage-associated protein
MHAHPFRAAIHFRRFNQPKATQAAARLLKSRGSRMNYMKLIKLLYLADREALARWGRPITTASYPAMPHGPVLSQILDLINEQPDPSAAESPWSHHISEPERYEICLKQPDVPGDLPEAEDALLDEISAKCGHLTRWHIRDLAHTLPEWHDPQGGAFPITVADILKAQHKSPDEIRAIESQVSNLVQIDSPFSHALT